MDTFEESTSNRRKPFQVLDGETQRVVAGPCTRSMRTSCWTLFRFTVEYKRIFLFVGKTIPPLSCFRYTPPLVCSCFFVTCRTIMHVHMSFAKQAVIMVLWFHFWGFQIQRGVFFLINMSCFDCMVVVVLCAIVTGSGKGRGCIGSWRSYWSGTGRVMSSLSAGPDQGSERLFMVGRCAGGAKWIFLLNGQAPPRRRGMLLSRLEYHPWLQVSHWSKCRPSKMCGGVLQRRKAKDFIV